MATIVHLAVDITESEEVACGSADWEEPMSNQPAKVTCPRCVPAARNASLALYGTDVLA